MLSQPGFFKPNPLQAWVTGKPATSWYDTVALQEALERLVDFDRINARETRFSVCAVNVCTGDFAYFENAHRRIGPEHIMASGALPPGFPAVEIDGELYWDGGLVSNTPLQYVLESYPRHSTLAFQVDLFPAHGIAPGNLEQVEERRKDYEFSRATMSAHWQQGAADARAAMAAEPWLSLAPEEVGVRTFDILHTH